MENIYTEKHSITTGKRGFPLSPDSNTQKYEINLVKLSGNVLCNKVPAKFKERQYLLISYRKFETYGGLAQYTRS